MKQTIHLFLLISFCFLLCSCGFAPMHSDTNISTKTRDIFIEPISGTNGIDMRNALRASFGTDNNNEIAKYKLSVNLAAPYTIYKAIQKTGDATWQEVRLTATYKLTDTTTNKTVTTGTDMASESYTFVRDLVAAQASYNNAVQSAIRVLSEKIENHISAKLSD